MNAVISIMDLVESRLALITEVNGYNYTITNIKRSKLTPWVSDDLPGLNYWSTGLGNNESDYGGDERQIPLFIEAHTKTHDEAFLDVASKLAEDIITALNRAPSAPLVSDDPSYNLGEVVSDLSFDGYDHEIGQGQEPWCGVLVRVTIKYMAEIFNMTSYGV